jgi:hypothetical protein
MIQHPSGTPGAAALLTVGVPTPTQLPAAPFDLTAALGHMRSASMNAGVVPADAGRDGVDAFLKTYGGVVAVAVATVGPIGIVRSGALVTLRPESSYVARGRAADRAQNVA